MDNHIYRTAEKRLLHLSEQYPIVTITGPRQAGKTTLTRHALPDFDYVSMEDPDAEDFFNRDAKGFLMAHPAPCIFDEVQRTPKLLRYLQVLVDRERRNGMYVLTGSQQMNLRASVAESLAGRTALMTLLPLSISELQAAGASTERDALLFRGLMPRAYEQPIEPPQLYADYVSTYVERDALQLVRLRDLSAFRTFLRLLAGRVGQLVNYSSLGNDAGISDSTVREWLNVLEASYIIFPLTPYFANFGKRLVKHPKIYFNEPGLVAHLLGINTAEQVGRDPLLGSLFENMVVVEARKQLLNRGVSPALFFYRESRGAEVDLVWDSPRGLVPMEIKAAYSPNRSFTQNTDHFRALFPKADKGAVIYAGETQPGSRQADFINFCALGDYLSRF